MKKIRGKILIVVIFLVGIFLRLYKLDIIPTGFFRDEAALGYNAYSIWLTGKDEFGQTLPLIFRSFEVFFLPLYVYLSAPIVGILGLSVFSTRLLSALAGIFALISIFYIANKIWNRKVAVFSLFILAISPWHILYGRGAFEGNLALTLFSFGFLYFTYFIESERQKYCYLSFMFFALSMYSYQSERVVVPLLGLAILILNYKKLWNLRRIIILPAIFALVLLIPILSVTSKAASVHRAFGVSLFNKPLHGFNSELPKGFFNNNPYFLRINQISGLYVSYFSPRNLFIEGDWEKQRSVDGNSVFYPWLLPFLLLGFWKLIKRRKPEDKFLLAWVLSAPIPAALTSDPFHTYRSLLLYFPLAILIAFGLAEAYTGIKQKFAFMVVFSGIAILSLVYFIFNYAITTQIVRARSWDFGYKEIVSFINENNFEKVIVHDPWTESYIHFLFFGKVRPEDYHEAVYEMNKPVDYYYQSPEEIRPVKFEKLEFRLVDWPSERGNKGTVFVFWGEDLPESEFITDPKIELLREIHYPDGSVAYRIVGIKE